MAYSEYSSDYGLKGKTFKVEVSNALCADILRVMIGQGILTEIESPVIQTPTYTNIPPIHVTAFQTGLVTNPEIDRNRFFGNGMPIESNIEGIAKEYIRKCEERKHWSKALKEAVKEYGHDEVLEAFYEWARSQDNFLGPKPVTKFLQNVSSYIGTVGKPAVTNPALSRVDTRIAYVSDNQVFFSGEYRFKLAALINTYGEELVISAFEIFFQSVEPKEVTWASRNFIQRASVMIETIILQRAERQKQEAQIQSSYKAAKDGIVEEPEEDEDL